MPVDKKKLKPKVLEMLGEGFELLDICKKLGLAESTVRSWRTKDKDFKTLYASVADKREQQKEVFLEELGKRLGIISQACKATGISRKTFYNWRKQDPDFGQAAEDIQEEVLDFVEGKFLQSIQSMNVAAQIFYLKTKGRKRGYIEVQRNEHTGSDGGKLTVELSLTAKDLSNDDLEPNE